MKKSVLIAVFLFSVLSSRAEMVWDAREAGLQLSITPLGPSLHSKDTFIHGLSLNLWGQNPQRGVALGLINGSTGESAGFSLGCINYADSYKGVHWGLINVNKNFNGWELGLLNYSSEACIGLQSGVVNIARDFNGLQLGAINYADNLHGVQIGLLNIATHNPWFGDLPDKMAPVFPLLNWSF